MSIRKSFKVLLSLFMTVSLAGCGSPAESGSTEKPQKEETQKKEEPTPETETEPAAETSSKDQIYHAGDTITTDEFIFTVTDLGFADTVSMTSDDSFFLKADKGYDARENSRFLYYSVDFQYIDSVADEIYSPFYVPEYTIDNATFVSGSVSAFRKEGDKWMISAYSGDGSFMFLTSSVGMEYNDRYEFQPSDQKYQARGLIYVSNDNLSKGTLTVKIRKYKFEVSE